MADIVLSKEGFGLKLYDRFPPRYREDDIDTNYSLRRYLEAAAEGGFNYSIDEWNGILNFADPDKATPQVLPLLFKQFGLSVFNGIPETFLRYLLPRLGTAWSKKGGLDVIEFVSSSISGIKTSTVVHSLPNGDVDIDVRLEMDFSLGDYLPDQKKFIRILSQFTPFYLDLRIIYVYRYHDRIYIVTEDVPHDHVIHTVNDFGCITPDGYVEDPVMFPANKGLNVDFILNYRKPVAPVPDVFFDSVIYRTDETGSINSRWSPVNPKYSVYYCGFLNNTLDFQSNRTSYYNDVYVEVDQHFDHIKHAPVLDMSALRGTDSRKDCPRFINSEAGTFSADLSVFDKQITLYHDKPVLDGDTFVNNTVDILDNEPTTLDGDDNRLDHVCIGLHPLFFYMLNTDFTLNKGFITNANTDEYGKIDSEEKEYGEVCYTTLETGIFDPNGINHYDHTKTRSVEDGEFSGEETERQNVNYSNVDAGNIHVEGTLSSDVFSRVSESAVFSVVVSPVLGILTNATRVLNDSGFNVPDGYDIVSCNDGTKTTVFF